MSALPLTGAAVERRRVGWRVGSTLAAVAAVVVLYIWDDALFAAPIIVATRLIGPWTAFVLFSLIYGVASFALALLAVATYDRAATGEPSRLAKWLDHQEAKRRTVLAKRLLDTGKVFGFIVSSFVLGGIVTTWLVHYSGRSRGIRKTAALSCAIFGITFSGMYTGLAQAIFSI